MNSSILKRSVSTLLALLLLFYVGYQVYMSHNTKIKTETANYFTASNAVQTTITAIRKEAVLTYGKGNKGVIDFAVKSGEKVASGGTVAKIYADAAQVSALHGLEDTQNEITQLQTLQAPGSTYSESPDSLNGRICGKLTDILGGLDENDLSGAYRSENDLLDLISERQIVTGQTPNFSARVASLQEQCRQLKARAGSAQGSVISPESGYFIRDVDGLESAVNYSDVLSVDCDRIRNLQKEKMTVATDAIGKICEDYEWYMVGIVPAGQVSAFRQLDSEDTVTVRFPFVSGTSVVATVAAINQKGANSEAAVVLKCKDMNASLAGIRSQSVQIVTSEYTGLRVSQKAIHFLKAGQTGENQNSAAQKGTGKEVEGIYILYGTQLSFRQIVPEYSTDSYVICDPIPDKNSLCTEGTVKLYDEVVVEGTDLYDGKVVQ